MNSDKKIKLQLQDDFQYQELLNNGDDLTNLVSNRNATDRILKTNSSHHLEFQAIEQELLKLKENRNGLEKKFISTLDLPNIHNLKKETFISEPKPGKIDFSSKGRFQVKLENSNQKPELKKNINNSKSNKHKFIKSMEYNVLGTPMKQNFRLVTEVSKKDLKKFCEENLVKIQEKQNKTDVFEYLPKESFEKYKRKKPQDIEEDNNLVNVFLNKQKFYSTLITFFVLLNLGLNMVDISLYVNSLNMMLESSFKGNEPRIYTEKMIENVRNRHITSEEFFIRIFNHCVIIIIDICIVLQYQVEVDIAKYYRTCQEDDSIVSFSIFKRMILEMLVLSIFFPPDYLIITDFNEKRYLYTLNAFICVISTIKIYVVGNSIFYYSKWREQSNIVICKKYKVNPDLTFVNLAMFKQHLILFNMITFFISVFYLGFLLWCFDMGIFVSDDSHNYVKVNDYDISTCIYLILQTCTTLGYGELVQSSYTGRFIAISSVIFGWVCLSLIIVFSFKKLDFDEEELKAYYEYKKREIKDITEKKAISLIKMFMRFRYMLIVKKDTYNFLTDQGDKYQYETFLTLRRSKRKNSVNNTKLKKLIDKDKDNIYVLRFYNKIFGFNTLYSYVIDFFKSNRILKCYLPTLEVKMQNFITAIDENYKKLNFMIDSLQTIEIELKQQAQESRDSQSKLIKIEEIQSKIARFFIKLNNQNFSKKNGYSFNYDLPYYRRSSSADISENMFN